MDPRAADRFGIVMSITLEDGEGEILNFSETGILFEAETETESKVGVKIAMTLHYSMDGHDYHLGCKAEVVRVVRVGRKVNVAPGY